MIINDLRLGLDTFLPIVKMLLPFVLVQYRLGALNFGNPHLMSKVRPSPLKLDMTQRQPRIWFRLWLPDPFFALRLLLWLRSNNACSCD